MKAKSIQDPRSELIEKTALHKKLFQEDVVLVSEQMEKVLVNTLIIGGVLGLGYFLARQFSGSDKPSPRKKMAKPVQADQEEVPMNGSEKENLFSEVKTIIASQVTAFLLTLAKEKLTEYLQSQEKKENPS